jgi:hypothetical protein
MIFTFAIACVRVRRRSLLRAAGAAVTVGLAGCTSEDGESSTPSTSGESGVDSDLRTPIAEFVTAFDDGDKQAIIDAYHPNSPFVPNRDNIYFPQSAALDDLTVVERSSDSAVLRADVTLTDDSGETEQVVHTYELRPNDGEWDIYIFVVGTELPDTGTETGGETGTEAPSVAFQTEYEESQSEGAATGVLTITHTSGDTLDASNVSIRGSGIVAVDGAAPDVTSPNTRWATATGVEEIAAGNAITVGVEADYEVFVVWESGDSSTTLAASSGP